MYHPYTPTLLSADEPAAVSVELPQATSPFLLLCDHAGQAIPKRLGDLGLASGDIDRISVGISVRWRFPACWPNSWMRH